ncbi:MAG: DUF4097 family beta strand repeat protein, partial [Oscillospiraceae bacterium]|nr:DUF4097 family beta strand repeat protein [Oscillospiraceae bacterium]
LSIETTTGDIELEHCNAATLYIKATTGDIKASLLSEKTFIASATTGDVRVPQGGSGGECEIKTTTGDINVTVK